MMSTNISWRVLVVFAVASTVIFVTYSHIFISGDQTRDETELRVTKTSVEREHSPVSASDPGHLLVSASDPGHLPVSASEPGHLGGEGQCKIKHVVVEPEECERHTKEEEREPQMFPLHFVSGAPGSGNDWILWLGLLSRYTWPRVKRQTDCEAYHSAIHFSEISRTNCLFIKSHEPWVFVAKNINIYASRAALLLRHPYDAIFAEYKRQLTVRIGKLSKSSSNGISTEKFIDVKTNTSVAAWRKEQIRYIAKWVKHATYFLTEFDKPLHVLLYNNVRTDTEHEIESLQSFFGYKFDGVNFRRHCCAMEDSTNSKLKRVLSPVDSYREVMYEKDREIREMMESGVSRVHEMLDKKYPDMRYRIGRG